MISIKRPTDVWLRVWLVVLWWTILIINDLWLKYQFDQRGALEHFVVSIFAFILCAALWFAFKRPDCTCWDDIKDENERIDDAELRESGERYAKAINGAKANDHPHRMHFMGNPAIPEDESHVAKWQQVINDDEWKAADQGPSWGYGGTDG